MTWRLRRTRQCGKCPWRVGVDPHAIPGGYCERKHAALKDTIREGFAAGPAMACHESAPGDEDYCIGWLAHQAGPGNNIGLRLSLMSCENAREIELVGEQHERFEDTLPRRRSRRITSSKETT